MKILATLLLLLSLQSSSYFLQITARVPVEASAVKVEGFGYRNLTVSSSGTVTTVRWTADRECFDVRVSGPRIVGRSIHLTECDVVALPLVMGP